jgi:hypothetical protein
VLIHIGWARAASTAFRQNFLRRHPQILAVDRFQQFEDGPAAAILQHLKSGENGKFQDHLAPLSQAWTRYARSRSGRLICLTDEVLSIGLPNTGVLPTAIAARCGQLFPGARVLAVVRDQVDAVRSLHALSLRDSRDRTPLSQWVDRYFLDPISGENTAHLFSYMDTLQAYLDCQRTRDVFVLPYTRLRDDPQRAYRDIASWLGISPSACRNLPNEIVNASPRPDTALKSAAWSFAPGQEAAIRELYANDNDRLKREFAEYFGVGGDAF